MIFREAFSWDSRIKICEISSTKFQGCYAFHVCEFLIQEIKVQELSEDVPVGRIPRSLQVQIKGALTRCVG